MNKRTRYSLWIGSIIVPLVLIWFGGFRRIAPVARLAHFLLPAWSIFVILAALVSFFGFSISKSEEQNQMSADLRSLRPSDWLRALDVAGDFLVVCAAATVGWYWSASLWALQAVVFAVVIYWMRTNKTEEKIRV